MKKFLIYFSVLKGKRISKVKLNFQVLIKKIQKVKMNKLKKRGIFSVLLLAKYSSILWGLNN